MYHPTTASWMKAGAQLTMIVKSTKFATTPTLASWQKADVETQQIAKRVLNAMEHLNASDSAIRTAAPHKPTSAALLPNTACKDKQGSTAKNVLQVWMAIASPAVGLDSSALQTTIAEMFPQMEGPHLACFAFRSKKYPYVTVS